MRNAFGDAVFRWLAKPILREINARRLRHGLPRLAGSVLKSASLAQIAQQPAFFDYPRERLPDCFYYTGPWHAVERGDTVEFPWQKLDGRRSLCVMRVESVTRRDALQFVVHACKMSR